MMKQGTTQRSETMNEALTSEDKATLKRIAGTLIIKNLAEGYDYDGAKKAAFTRLYSEFPEVMRAWLG